MLDRQNVESGLKHCIDLRVCAGCPYSRYAECTMMLLKDLYQFAKTSRKWMENA